MTDICFALRPRPWQEFGPGLYDHLQIIINWVSMTDQGTHKTVIEQLGPLPFLFLLVYFPENCGNRLGVMSSFVYNQWTGFTGERFRVQTFVVHRWWNRKREKNAGSPQKENGKESGPGKEISETNEGKSKRPRMYCKFGG